MAALHYKITPEKHCTSQIDVGYLTVWEESVGGFFPLNLIVVVSFSHPEHQEHRAKTSNVVAIQILMAPARCIGLCGMVSEFYGVR